MVLTHSEVYPGPKINGEMLHQRTMIIFT